MMQRAAFLMVAAYAPLMTAWVVTNPPGFAPGEPAHYVKSVAASRGGSSDRRLTTWAALVVATGLALAAIGVRALRDGRDPAEAPIIGA